MPSRKSVMPVRSSGLRGNLAPARVTAFAKHECLFGVGTGRPSRRTEDRKPVIDGHPRVEAIRVRSVRGELIAQDSRNVLAFAQQPGHIQVVAALEVAPQQRKLFRPPSP